MISMRTRGLVIGMVLGIVWMWLGFGAALLTAALGILGWLIGAAVSSVAAGNVNIADLWDNLRGGGNAS